MRNKILRRLRLPLALAGTLALGGSGRADSLWMRRDPHSAYLFVDNVARHVGDLLTIVIQESTSIDSDEQRDNEKKTTTLANYNMAGSTTGNVITKTAQAQLNNELDSDRKLEGSARYTSDRNLTDRVTVTVVDVLPNGNLVIEGIRRRLINGEERTLRLTGLVRPMDIAAGNTVLSQYVGNLQISLLGCGQDSAYINNGWLGCIMNHLWPF